jgi:hypothetical protein
MLTPGWIRTVILAAAGITALLLIISGEDLTWDLARPVGLAASAVIWLVVFYERTAWHWPIIRNLSRRPDLRGTWRTELRTTYAPRADEVIPCYLVVRQTFATASVRALFDRSTSSTVVCDLSERDGTWTLTYMMRSQKRSLEDLDNPSQRGSAELVVADDEARHLEGDYWMELGSRGQVTTTGRTKKSFGTYRTASEAEYT